MTLQTPDVSRYVPALAVAQGFQQVAGPRHRMPGGIQGLGTVHTNPPMPVVPPPMQPSASPWGWNSVPPFDAAAAHTAGQPEGAGAVSQRQNDGQAEEPPVSSAAATRLRDHLPAADHGRGTERVGQGQGNVGYYTQNNQFLYQDYLNRSYQHSQNI